MTQEKFIKVLNSEEYSYEIEGDKIIVTDEGAVNLWYLISLPPGVVFENGGNVYLNSLISIPPGVEFKNRGSVNTDALTGYLFSKSKGNIKGIDSTRLLNVMISKGLLER